MSCLQLLYTIMSSRWHQPVTEPNRWNVVSPLISVSEEYVFFKRQRWFLLEGWSFLRYQLMLHVELKRISVCARGTRVQWQPRISDFPWEETDTHVVSSLQQVVRAIISLSFFYQTIVERAAFHSSFLSFHSYEHENTSTASSLKRIPVVPLTSVLACSFLCNCLA